MPTVTVIIPNYNHTRYVGDAIRSVLRQSYRDFEIIVVDDGSTDGCEDFVAGFGVHYVRQPNQGLAAARNTGIHAAQGELIGLLDADDQWLPDFLEHMVSLAITYPEAAAYYCSAQAMDASGRDLPQVFGGPARTPDTLYHHLLGANFIIPSTVVMRRSAVVAAGLFDHKLRSCEDWDLWLRLLATHTIAGLSQCLVRYRVHQNSLSTNPDTMQSAARAVVEKHFGPDDGHVHNWKPTKRRAYGGLYRYQTITSVQRQADWRVAAQHFSHALQADPSLARDADFFYELALGAQPQGYRGTGHKLDLLHNATCIDRLLGEVFQSAADLDRGYLNRQARGTAWYALGLVAYNTEQLSPGLLYTLKAVWFRPRLVLDRRVAGVLLKAPLGRSMLRWLRRYKAQLAPFLGMIYRPVTRG